MKFWLKQSDRIILFTGVVLALSAILYPRVNALVGRVCSRVNVPRAGNGKVIEIQQVKVALPELSRTRDRLDLNDATTSELQSLDGLGQVLAQKVVRFRKEHGKFASAEELMKVSGIGPHKLEAIAEFVYVKG